MKVDKNDLSLVLKIVQIIDNSRLKKATIPYLWNRLNLPGSEYRRFCRILKKFFKIEGWSRQDCSNYYRARKDLVLPKRDTSEPPENPPYDPVPPVIRRKAFVPPTNAAMYELARDAKEAETDKAWEENEKLLEARQNEERIEREQRGTT